MSPVLLVFAACHDVGYIFDLTAYVGNSSKFTLVNTPGIQFHDEFTKLRMGIEKFRGVFPPIAINYAKTICIFYTIGKCRYGKTCKLLHPGESESQEYSANQHSLDKPPVRNSTASLGAFLDRPAVFLSLPQKSEIPEGCPTINNSNYRIDTYLPAPRADAIVSRPASTSGASATASTSTRFVMPAIAANTTTSRSTRTS
ncbi:hypothetical protein N0V88_006350 [Collariella sp. IMI 366227]|nr:hypothetical protein N0V88_006350 [Collariella sp. IMI 366227]